MKPIPISAAERIAKEFGYDQVIIIARKTGDKPEPNGEHVTTYGINKAHCAVAARAGDFLKYKVMGWAKDEPAADDRLASAYAMCAVAPSLSNVDAVALYDALYRKQAAK